MDDYGDDHGLRWSILESSTVIVARYRPPFPRGLLNLECGGSLSRRSAEREGGSPKRACERRTSTTLLRRTGADPAHRGKAVSPLRSATALQIGDLPDDPSFDTMPESASQNPLCASLDGLPAAIVYC